jgi:pentatricopeptide repeat protein
MQLWRDLIAAKVTPSDFTLAAMVRCLGDTGQTADLGMIAQYIERTVARTAPSVSAAKSAVAPQTAPDSGVPSVVAELTKTPSLLVSLIAAFARCGDFHSAKRYYEELRQLPGEPSEWGYVTYLKACSRLNMSADAWKAFEEAVVRLCSSGIALNTCASAGQP